MGFVLLTGVLFAQPHLQIMSKLFRLSHYRYSSSCKDVRNESRTVFVVWSRLTLLLFLVPIGRNTVLDCRVRSLLKMGLVISDLFISM